jgi:3',5'-cyclic AMP phosphodiesterase CpdA
MAIVIAHFTDLHITEPPLQVGIASLLGKRVIGWANLVFRGRYSAVQFAPEVAEALVKDIREIDPDHVVVTGDVTSLSLPVEFETVHKILKPLFQPRKVTLLQGNHDVYISSVVRDKLFEKWFSKWSRSDLEEGSEMLNGCRDYPYPIVRLLSDEVVLLCLRDSRPTKFYDSSGEVPSEQLDALERILSSKIVSGRKIILGLHYGLVDKFGQPDRRFHRLHNAERIIDLANRYNISLVIHGHIHERFVHRQNVIGGMAIANPGSVAHRGYSMAYHLYDIHEGFIGLRSRRYNTDTNVFSPWDEAPGNGVIWRAKN